MTGVKRITTGYTPRKLQKVVHKCLKRFNVLVCHRRFGKTVLCINELIDRALSNPLRNPQYVYLAPTYKQAKKIAWQYIVDYTRNIPGVKVNKSELTVYIKRDWFIDPENGENDPDTISIMLAGSDDPDSYRGMYFDGGIIDEYAQCDPSIWGQILRPALSDRGKIAKDLGLKWDLKQQPLDPWIIFIGTPKGKNHFWKRFVSAQEMEAWAESYEDSNDVDEVRVKMGEWEVAKGITPETTDVELKEILRKSTSDEAERYNMWRKYKANSNWFTSIYKASETGIVSQEELDEMRADLTDEEVEQELECSFTAAILGSYFGHLLNQAEREERIGVVPYDPRYPVETFWDIGVGDKCTIWFRQRVGAMYHYIDYYENNGEGVEHYAKVIKDKGYIYGRHIWPHDGKVKEFGSGQTRQETARKLGLIVEIQPRQAVDDRISASRARIRISRFDKEKCARGLDCLYDYQKEWDEKTMMFKEKPKHNWASHGSDSFGYSALDDRVSTRDDDWVNNKQVQADDDWDELGY